MTRMPAIGLPFVLLLLGACESPIVGAECRPGFVDCDGECVDLQQDHRHCGRCGESCGAYTCEAAECTDELRPDASRPQPTDGGRPDAGADAAVIDPDAGERPPPGVTPGGLGRPFLPDGGIDLPPDVSGCGIGQTACNEACVVTQTDPEHCGMCGVACGPGEYCAAGMCEDICDPPLTLCSGLCVLLDEDWRHCGSCGNLCASGICRDGECADAVAGHLVVVGHDYSGSGVPPSMERIGGGALFLAAGAPVRTIAYRGSASAASVQGVNRAIERVVREDGRMWQRQEVAADEVSARLIGADAFIIHPQPDASDEELRELGEQWGRALSQFIQRGGVVVLFETASSTNAGTYHLLEPALLFIAAGRERISTQDLTVIEPGVGVARRATRTYRSVPVSVRFIDVTSPGQVIVEDGDGEPVIIHRIVAP